MPCRMTDEAVNVEANALNSVCSGGKLRLYHGVQPAIGGGEITTQELLAEITLPSPCFQPARAGVVSAYALDDPQGLADGTPTWYRVVGKNGKPLWDVDVAKARPVKRGKPYHIPWLEHEVVKQ